MGDTPSWAIDTLDAQLGRLRGAIDTLWGVRAALAAAGDDMVWRSQAASGFHMQLARRIEDIELLARSLAAMEAALQRTRARLLSMQQFSG